jgi:site-specific recombinase XerD
MAYMPLLFSFSQVLDAYHEIHLASRNAAPGTREDYRIDLRQLGEYLHSVGVTTVNAVNRIHIEGFLADLDGQGVTNNTRRRKLAAVKSFFKFAEESGYRKGNPAAAVIPPSLERNQPRYLTKPEYERLRRAVRHEPRDAAIIELLLQTGVGLSEVARLRLPDIELPDRREAAKSVGSARIWRGRHHRMVTLNSKVCEALRGYLLVRPVDAGDDMVFQSKFRRGMGVRSIEDVVSKYLKDAGIWGASVRSLRHTFATHTVKSGTSVGVVQKVLGHASRKTTGVYVELAREEMDRQLQENAL